MVGPAFSRRTLLRAGAVAGVATAVAAEAPSAGAVEGLPLRFTDFRALVGTSFSVRDSSGRTRALELVEATVTPVVSAVPGAGECYALLFRGGRGARMRSGTYTLRHPALGSVDLFLHPVGPTRAYEAVVNRWRPLN